LTPSACATPTPSAAHFRSRLRTAIRRAEILDEVNKAGRSDRKDRIVVHHRKQMPRDEAVVRQAFHAPPERAPAQLVSVVAHELPQLRLRHVLAVHDLAQQRQILSWAERNCSFEIPHAGLTSLRATTCHPWPIPPRVHAERSLLAMHPSKWRQDEQDLLLPVSFAERNHLRGVALPGAPSVDPSRVGRADPEQVNIGARASGVNCRRKSLFRPFQTTRPPTRKRDG
jgi:hypothetical protein